MTDLLTQEERKKLQIQIQKNYLASTDYIVIKIYEALIKGNDIEPLKAEYATELARRDEARAKINELENDL